MLTIGVPKEIKAQEGRIALLPSGVQELIRDGHQVLVQQDAGLATGFSNEEYLLAGATLPSTAEEIYERSELILKVKEPQLSELPLIRSGQVLFTYLHLASSLQLTQGLLDKNCTRLAYETLEDRAGKTPLLIPMSEIAGRLSVQMGAWALEAPHGGSGILLGGVPGIKPAKVLIIGGGSVGAEAAKMAAGLGARVTILESNPDRIRQLNQFMPANVTTLFSNSEALKNECADTDLLIGGLLLRGAAAPKLLNAEHFESMRDSSVFIDVAIDQGGCATSSRPTTHASPIYKAHGVQHFCVPNLPAAVCRTSTLALCHSTLPYIRILAKQSALFQNPKRLREVEELHGSLQLAAGTLYNRAVGLSLNLAVGDSG